MVHTSVMRVAVVGHVEWIRFARVDRVPVAGRDRARVRRLGAGGGRRRRRGGAARAPRRRGAPVHRARRRRARAGARGRSSSRAAWSSMPRPTSGRSGGPSRRSTITASGRSRPSARSSDRGATTSSCRGTSSRRWTPSSSSPATSTRWCMPAVPGVLTATSRELEVLRRAGVGLDALIGSGEDDAERYRPGELDPRAEARRHDVRRPRRLGAARRPVHGRRPAGRGRRRIRRGRQLRRRPHLRARHRARGPRRARVRRALRRRRADRPRRRAPARGDDDVSGTRRASGADPDDELESAPRTRRELDRPGGGVEGDSASRHRDPADVLPAGRRSRSRSVGTGGASTPTRTMSPRRERTYDTGPKLVGAPVTRIGLPRGSQARGVANARSSPIGAPRASAPLVDESEAERLEEGGAVPPFGGRYIDPSRALREAARPWPPPRRRTCRASSRPRASRTGSARARPAGLRRRGTARR